MRPRCVLLDRDGVINEDAERGILDTAAWQPLPGSVAAIARLTATGIPVAVCTNQSAVARGYLSETTLRGIHARMATVIESAGGRLEAVFYCPHGPDDGCRCRKPAPGLIEQALARLDCPPAQAVMIGDSRRDLDAAARAGVPGWLVRTGNGQATAREMGAVVPVHDDLMAAVEAMLS
jgi:D-glycero-D-manno-heptose 1,7-bisphosphate phosphatase